MEKKKVIAKEREKAQKAFSLKKEGKKQAKGFPLAAVIALCIFFLAAGLVISQVFLQKTAQLPDGSVNKGTFEETSLEVKLIYNSDCKICYQATSLQNLLQQRKIKYSIEKLDMKEKENGIIAGNFGLKNFPVTILKWKDLKLADPELYALMQKIFKVKDEYMIIPEADLAKEMNGFSPIMFLEAPTSERCGVKQGTVRLDEYRDFFSKYSYENRGTMEKIEKDFNGEIEINHKSFPSTEQSKKAAIGFECAKEQGLEKEFANALFSSLFEKIIDISDANVLKKIATEQNIPDQNAFDRCIDSNKTKQIVEKDLNEALQYKLFISPSLAIDCIYTTIETDKLENQICAIHPGFNACKKESK